MAVIIDEKTELKSMLRIIDLNDDVLSMIFDSCAISDLLNLYYVCTRFQTILRQSTFQRRSRDLLLLGHRNTSAICSQRTVQCFSYHRRMKIFQNWCHGRYAEHILFHQSQFNPSRIHLEKELLFKSHSGQLKVFRRSKHADEVLNRRPIRTYGDIRDADITCFMKDDRNIFIGRRNGRVKIIALNETENDSLDELNVSSHNGSESRVESIDFSGDTFVTATLQRTAVWHKHFDLDTPYLDQLYELENGYKCIKISPGKRQLAMGKYKDISRKALRLVNLETQTVTKLQSNSTSIYDVQWKDENILLTGHYDTTFRLFDCRTNHDEHIWQDPYDLAVYSICYDGSYGVLCGMKYHCRVNLYDLRVPNKYIQLYFPISRFRGSSGISSPAYQVINDQSQLFITTDHNLRVLDFDADWAEAKDYTNIFVHEIIVNINSNIG